MQFHNPQFSTVWSASVAHLHRDKLHWSTYIQRMYNWNQSEDAHGKCSAPVRKNHHRHWYQKAHWCLSQHILSAKNSSAAAQTLHHSLLHTIIHIHIWPLRASIVPRCENCMAVHPALWWMFEHCPPHSIQLVLNSVPHTGISMQQDDGTVSLTLRFLLIVLCSTVSLQKLNSRKRGPSISKNTVNISFLADASDLGFSVEWTGVSTLHAYWFSCKFKMVTPCPLSQQNPPSKCITINTVPLHMFQQQWQLILLWCVCVCVSGHEAHWQYTQCYPRSLLIARTVPTHTQFHWHGTNAWAQTLSVLMHSILALCRILWLVTTRACPSLGTSVACCLPVWIIWSVTSIIFDTHAAPWMTHMHIRLSAGWHPCDARNWITTHSKSGTPSSGYTVMLSIPATHPVNCAVLCKRLPASLRSQMQIAASWMHSSCT